MVLISLQLDLDGFIGLKSPHDQWIDSGSVTNWIQMVSTGFKWFQLALDGFD